VFEGEHRKCGGYPYGLPWPHKDWSWAALALTLALPLALAYPTLSPNPGESWPFLRVSFCFLTVLVKHGPFKRERKADVGNFFFQCGFAPSRALWGSMF